MGRWPSYRVWRKQERQRRLSEFLFSIADHLPDWNVSALPHLKHCAKHRKDESQGMSVRCPEGLQVKPAFVSYYDLFYTEDLPTLQQGLVRWYCEHERKAQPFILQPKEHIQELFRGWSQRPIGGGWSRAGQIQVNPAGREWGRVSIINYWPSGRPSLAGNFMRVASIRLAELDMRQGDRI
jgi:hypothetical protein